MYLMRVIGNVFKLKFNTARTCQISLSKHLSVEAPRPVDLAHNAFENTGSGQEAAPLIIMHGLFGSKQNWRSISKAINAKTTPHRKVIAVDARNHGESPHSPEHSYEHLAEDILELMRTQSIQRTAIMGHSMGGRAMMYFALKYPNLVDRAIFVDISPVTSPTSLLEMEGIFNAMKTISVPEGLSMSEGRYIVQGHLQKSIADRATIDFILLNLKRTENGRFYWSANVDALHTNFNSISKFPENATSMQYRGPVLFIGGSKSEFINKNDLPKIRKMFPAANIVWIDTGHLVQVENPATFLSHTIDFLNLQTP